MLLEPFQTAAGDTSPAAVDERHVSPTRTTRRPELEANKTPGWCRLPK